MEINKLFYKFILLFLIILFCSSFAGAADGLTLHIKSHTYQGVSYHIEDGELLVPARTVIRGLGGKLEWYDLLQILTARFDERELKLQIDNSKVHIKPGGQVKYLSVPPRIIDGQTMIPLPFFAKELGLLYKWDEENNEAWIYKPSNWVLDLIFEESDKGDKLIINSTNKVPYSSMVLEDPDRLVIDIKKSALSAKVSNINWESYIFKNVRVSQFDQETVRVVLEFNNQVQYDILEDKDSGGFKLIVAFEPGIRNIDLVDKGLNIKSSGEIRKYKVMRLTKPDRLVLDIPEHTFQMTRSEIDLNHKLIKRVRGSQNSWDPKVVRVVLDLAEQIDYKIERGASKKELVLIPERKVEPEPVEEENDSEGESDNNKKENDQSDGVEIVVEEVDTDDQVCQLTDIAINPHGSQSLELETSKPVDYTAWYLPNPDRIVVDLPETSLGISADKLTTQKGDIKNVRMHQYPDKVRVVFDLNNYSTHKILSSERTDQIKIGLGDRPLAGRIIVVDPGHGGSDPGAIGKGGIFEKDYTLNIGLKLKEHLKQAGATVIMTRDKDVYPTLEERAALANHLSADIFISIHCNSFVTREMGGTETYIARTPSAESIVLASEIQANLVNEIKLFDRGVKYEEFSVLVNTEMPAVLVEVAFISNIEEAKLLADDGFQAKSAAGMYNGILTYFAKQEGSDEK